MCQRHAALTPIGHALQVHHLLVIGAIVLHHEQHRDAMVRRGPQGAIYVEHVAIGLEPDTQAAMLPVRKRGADSD